MPKTDINTILKHGADTKLDDVDYSSPEQQKKLKEMKKKSEAALKNKWVSIDRLSKFIIRT